MFRLELTESEANMLRAVLNSYLSELRFEISNTENFELREELKTMDAFVKDLLRNRLVDKPQPAPVSA